jgi:hypothetical protein
VEVYYEGLLKLANSFEHKIIDNFLNFVFKSKLQPYMHVTTINLKRKTLRQHKKVVLVYEEGIFEVEVINNLLIPQNNKTILA